MKIGSADLAVSMTTTAEMRTPMAGDALNAMFSASRGAVAAIGLPESQGTPRDRRPA